MITKSALIYECSTEEARSLPRGFQFLEHDVLCNTVRTMTAGMDDVREDKRYVYLCYKEPPANWQSPIAGKRRASKAPRVTDKAMRRALDNV